MKKVLYILPLALVMLSVTSCKKEKKTDDIIVEKIVEKPQAEPETMGHDDRSGSVKWVMGGEYSYKIVRNANKELNIVENHGVQYYDNEITLTVKRSDGSTFFEKKFTKSNFAPGLTKQMREHGVLLGMSLERADGNFLRFVVAVGSPDESNDEFYYVVMKLSNMAQTSCEAYSEKDALEKQEAENNKKEE